MNGMNPYGFYAGDIGESEEDRRRRERNRRIKETITIDPITGEETVRIEGSPQDITALASQGFRVGSQRGRPQMPTMAQPEMPPQQPPQQPPQMPPQVTQQPPQPAAPVSPEMLAQQQRPQPRPRPQPQGQGLQPAPGAAQQLRPEQQLPQRTPIAQTTPDFDAIMQGAAVNPRVRNRLITSADTPPDVRRAAIDLERESLAREKATAEAQKKIQTAAESGNFNSIAQAIKKEQDGSILKAVFYKALGLTNLALEEEEKMGAGQKWASAMDPETGERAFILYSNDGLPLSGYDREGNPLSKSDLARYGAGSMAGQIDIVGGSFVNDQTGEVGRMVSDKRTGRSFIQTDTGLKPMQGFRPQASGGTLDMQQAQRTMQANVALQQDWAQLQNRVRSAAPEAQNRFLGEFNARHGTRFGLADLSGPPPQIDLQTGQITRGAMPAQAQGAAPQARPQAAPAAPVAPTAPQMQPPASQMQPPAPQMQPPAPAPGATPAAIEQQLAVETRAQGAAAEDIATDVAKAKINNNKIIEQVQSLEELGLQLLDHPGFTESVGASYLPGFQFIPGTDKASFYALFDQIKGQSFLAAIESMRGLGALSDREGAAATAAVTSLNLNMKEQDFRRSMHQLTSQMRRYADRNARKAGQPLPYNEPSMAEQSRENRQAQAWLKSARVGGRNPDGSTITREEIDGVRRRLQLRGEL